MHYHHNAKTNISQRQAIKGSDLSSRHLGETYCVSHVTTAKWKKSKGVKDHSSAPHTITYAVPKEWWVLVKKVRKGALLKLDDLVETLLPYIPSLNHSNCYRILKHYQLNRLPDKEKKKPRKFGFYLPGFLHIDVFYLPKLGENSRKKRYYCFLAIDRATRMLLVEVYSHKGQTEAADFATKCLKFFPFRIHHILTDNGREFSLKKARNRWGKVYSKGLLDIVCQIAGIKHKLTKVKHPWTNGMAERAVKTTKDHTFKVRYYASVNEAIVDLKRFQDYHNYWRKQGVLARKIPADVMIEWFVKKPNIFLKNPYRMLKKCKQRCET